jgi:predicted XRE-type DNA-binding protein
MTLEEDNTPSVRARKIASVVLKATQRDATQAAIAASIGISESTLSRLMSDHLDKFAQVLAHAGLKVVPVTVQCYSPEKIGALLTLARDHLAQIHGTEQLIWD